RFSGLFAASCHPLFVLISASAIEFGSNFGSKRSRRVSLSSGPCLLSKPRGPSAWSSWRWRARFHGGPLPRFGQSTNALGILCLPEIAIVRPHRIERVGGRQAHE